MEMELKQIPEVVGATTGPHALTDKSTTAHFSAGTPTGPALLATATGGEGAAQLYLNIENVTSTDQASGYDVYLNLPPNADPDQYPDHFVGSMHMFGVAEASRRDRQHPGTGLNYSLEATDVVKQLEAKRAWDPADVQVTFVPRHPTRPRGA